MKKQEIIMRTGIMTVLLLAASVLAAGKPAPVSLSSEGKKLEARYSKMLSDLKDEITRLEPKVDQKKKAEFTRQFGKLGNVTPVTKVVIVNSLCPTSPYTPTI